MRIFIAGIMQGSQTGTLLHDQQYRARLSDRLTEAFPGAEIYDPRANHHDSISYDANLGREVFYRHNRMCREVDVVVAFVPEASMGTAIEMWEAHEHGRAVVVAISPLKHNWAIRFCSHLVFSELPEFEAALASGELKRRIKEFSV